MARERAGLTEEALAEKIGTNEKRKPLARGRKGDNVRGCLS